MDNKTTELVEALRADLSAYWGGSDDERKSAETKVATLRQTYGETAYQEALAIVNASIRNQ